MVAYPGSNKKILGLDISMDYVLCMTVVECFGKIQNVPT